MELARALTSRRRHGLDGSSSHAHAPNRAYSVKTSSAHPGGIDRSAISLPMELVSSTNALAYNAPNIYPSSSEDSDGSCTLGTSSRATTPDLDAAGSPIDSKNPSILLNSYRQPSTRHGSRRPSRDDEDHRHQQQHQHQHQHQSQPSAQRPQPNQSHQARLPSQSQRSGADRYASANVQSQPPAIQAPISGHSSASPRLPPPGVHREEKHSHSTGGPETLLPNLHSTASAPIQSQRAPDQSTNPAPLLHGSGHGKGVPRPAGLNLKTSHRNPSRSISPVVSPDIFSAKPNVNHHPFGAELAQVDELAEGFSARDVIVMDEEERHMLDRGFCKFAAQDYVDDLQGLFGCSVTNPFVVPGWF